jgi:SOS-response transcriptional repressor LexA
MSAKKEPITSYLRETVEKRGILPSQLAAYVGVSHVTVGRWLKGEDVPSPDNCRKLATYLHVTEDTLLEMAGHRGKRADIQPPLTPEELIQRLRTELPISIPIVEQIGHADRGAIAQGYVYLPPQLARNRRLQAIYVKGDCMLPLIQEGDLIVVDLDASPSPSNVVVVLVDGDDVEVKRIARIADGRITLTCENPSYPDREVEDVKVIGVVIQVTKQLRG